MNQACFATRALVCDDWPPCIYQHTTLRPDGGRCDKYDNMNSAALEFTRQLEEERAAHGGLNEFRRHALKTLRLKTVVKVEWSARRPRLPSGRPTAESATHGRL
jgi:hypothetical protein